MRADGCSNKLGGNFPGHHLKCRWPNDKHLELIPYSLKIINTLSSLDNKHYHVAYVEMYKEYDNYAAPNQFIETAICDYHARLVLDYFRLCAWEEMREFNYETKRRGTVSDYYSGGRYVTSFGIPSSSASSGWSIPQRQATREKLVNTGN